MLSKSLRGKKRYSDICSLTEADGIRADRDRELAFVFTCEKEESEVSLRVYIDET